MTRWSALLAAGIAVSACAPTPPAEAAEWCDGHRAEVLIAAETQDRDELRRLMRNALTTRLAARARGESAYIMQNVGALSQTSRLEAVIAMEEYAEGIEANTFAAYSEADFDALASDHDAFTEACGRAYQIRLEIIDGRD